MKSPWIHLSAALVICGIAAAGYWVWNGMVETKSATVAALDTQIVTNTKAISRIAAIQASLADMSVYENSIENYFVPEANVASFNDSLEGMGKTQGAVTHVLSVAKGGSKARPQLAFTLSIDGTFDAVVRTIGVIEYAPYALTMGAFQLQNGGKNLWHADVNFTVGSLAAVSASSTAVTAAATSTKP